MNSEKKAFDKLNDEALEQVTGGYTPVPDPGAAPEPGGGYRWPVSGFHNVSEGFGQRFGAMHNGIVISAPGIMGAPVEAAESGTVVMAGSLGSGYGIHIIIDHHNGKQTVYAHLRDTVVNVGQNVCRGQVIGFVGDSGDATGPGLYFETRNNGIAYDPLTELV